MRPSTLKETFRKSGIYPICRDQITDDQVRSSLVYSHSDQSTLPSNSACQSSLPEPTRTSFVTSTMSTLSPPEQSTSQSETPSLLSQACESPLPQESEPLSSTSNPLSQTCELSFPEESEQSTLVSATRTPLPKASESSFSERSLVVGSTQNVSRRSYRLSQSAYSDAFDALESVLKTPVKVKYKRRLDEGYNLDGSPTYQTWKTLLTAASKNNSVNESTIQQQTPLTSTPCPRAASFSSYSVSTVLEEIIIYPSAPDNNNASRKNTKKTLPNYLNGEASMKILLDVKLKKARELAAKQKKLREREEKKEAKRRNQEAKKREVQERKQKKNQKFTEKERSAGKRRKRATSGREWRRSLPQQNDNSCKVCWQEYSPSDDENLPWVMCDQCELWMHIDCIPIGVDKTPIDNDRQFFCHDCR